MLSLELRELSAELEGLVDLIWNELLHEALTEVPGDDLLVTLVSVAGEGLTLKHAIPYVWLSKIQDQVSSLLVESHSLDLVSVVRIDT